MCGVCRVCVCDGKSLEPLEERAIEMCVLPFGAAINFKRLSAAGQRDSGTGTGNRKGFKVLLLK